MRGRVSPARGKGRGMEAVGRGGIRGEGAR